MDYKKKYFKYKEKYINLKNQLGGYIGPRAEYECRIYHYCNKKLGEIFDEKIQKSLVGIFCVFISEFILCFIHYQILNEFIELYNDKTNKVVITGAITIEPLIDKIRTGDDIRDHLNIRSCLTLLDMILKFILDRIKKNVIKGADDIKIVSTFFDDIIRTRILTEPVNITDSNKVYEHTTENYKFRAEEYKPRDELRINNLKTPYGDLVKGDDRCRVRETTDLSCCKMVDLLENYTDYERGKYKEDKFEKDLYIGSNLYTYGPEFFEDIDVFGAGLSGHTFDIFLLFSVFTDLNEKFKYFLILACLVWMLNFYHHSLREIFIVGTFFLHEPDKNNIKKLILELFNKRASEQESYDKIDIIFDILKENTSDIKEINNLNINRDNINKFFNSNTDLNTIKDILKSTIFGTDKLKKFIREIGRIPESSIIFPIEAYNEVSGSTTPGPTSPRSRPRSGPTSTGMKFASAASFASASAASESKDS
jgi:hypothetical protein